MATVRDGEIISDDGEWRFTGDKGVRMWERIKPATKKPGLVTRLLVKKSAWGRPGLAESKEAAKLAGGSFFDRKALEAAERTPRPLALSIALCNIAPRSS